MTSVWKRERTPVWLIPSQCLAPAPAAAVSTLDLDWLSRQLEQSCTWRGKPSASPFWRRRLNQVSWMRRLSGLISDPSRADAFVDAWTSFWREYRASRTASPVDVADSAIAVICGPRHAGSLRQINPASCGSKTSPASSRRACRASSPTWKAWATALRADCLRRRKSARRMSAAGSSCSPWPTPRREDAESCGNHPGAIDSLNAAVRTWSTPNVPARGPEQRASKRKRCSGGEDLQTQVFNWATPGGMGGGTRNRGGSRKGELLLAGQTAEWMKNWPTPTEFGNNNRRVAGAKSGDGLSTAVKLWPTPGANDHKGSACVGHRRRQLDEAAEQKFRSSRSDEASISTRSRERFATLPTKERNRKWRLLRWLAHVDSGMRGAALSVLGPTLRPRLNPNFVEHLMGWPIGWTASAVGATALSRWTRLMRSQLCGLVSRANDCAVDPLEAVA